MSIMASTDELCRLLDEHGVKYERIILSGWSVVWWKDANGITWRAHDNENDGLLSLYAYGSITPEQTIAATLGAGTCHDKNGFDPETGFECTVCGTMVDRYMVTPADTGHEVQFNSCPNCGRKVMGA